MVVTRLFAAAVIETRHDRVGSPSRWTAHAEHWPMPQPYLVPVRPRVSRNTQRRGVSGLTSTDSRLPLTVSVNTATTHPAVREDSCNVREAIPTRQRAAGGGGGAAGTSGPDRLPLDTHRAGTRSFGRDVENARSV